MRLCIDLEETGPSLLVSTTTDLLPRSCLVYLVFGVELELILALRRNGVVLSRDRVW